MSTFEFVWNGFWLTLACLPLLYIAWHWCWPYQTETYIGSVRTRYNQWGFTVIEFRFMRFNGSHGMQACAAYHVIWPWQQLDVRPWEHKDIEAMSKYPEGQGLRRTYTVGICRGGTHWLLELVSEQPLE